LATNLPRKLWILVCVLGVALAIVFAVLPVGAGFENDPLLRLRELDPQLSPPAATAVCGSPLRNLQTQPEGTSLYEVARSHACQEASRRRLLVAVAIGSALVMLGLVGLAAGREDLELAVPGRTKAVGLPSKVG
jgi:hypothetical protein